MKKQMLALAAAALMGAVSVSAENGMFAGFLPDNWTADVVAAIKYSRHYYSSNWHDGGTNSNSALIRYDADVKGDWAYANWRNLVHLAWGQEYTKGIGTRKAEDKIFWESIVDFNITKYVKPYAGVRFESQFTKSYSYSEDDAGKEIKKAISCFMDPGYLTEVAGLAFIPNDMFSQRVGFANKMTFSDGYGFADDPDTKKVETFKNEPGLESITEFKYNFSDLISFSSRLWAFVNFKGVDEIDGKWENALKIMVTPYLEFSFGNEVYYDKDLHKNTQYKDDIFFGLTWRWF